jgi:transposase
MRIIGLDIHRAFAEAVAWDDGKLKRLGRVDMRRPLLEAFAKKLSKEDVVVVEATRQRSFSRCRDRAARQASRDR